MLSEKVPASTAVKMKEPCASDTVTLLVCVATLSSVIVAPGMTAPVASSTVPLMLPVAASVEAVAGAGAFAGVGASGNSLAASSRCCATRAVATNGSTKIATHRASKNILHLVRRCTRCQFLITGNKFPTGQGYKICRREELSKCIKTLLDVAEYSRNQKLSGGNWRREWDSNPRYLAVNTLSKRAPSATRPSLHANNLDPENHRRIEAGIRILEYHSAMRV